MLPFTEWITVTHVRLTGLHQQRTQFSGRAEPHMRARDRWNTGVFLGQDCFPQFERGKKIVNMVFLWKFQGGGGGERCAAARLGSSLCQGYKQAVIRPPNRIILPVSAPKHMGPHKAAAAPDRHPLLITPRRGAGPFSMCRSRLCFGCSVWLSRKCVCF